MRKFYENKPVLFAILWIVIYVVWLAPLRGSRGDDSPIMLLSLAIFSAALLLFVRAFGLQGELGLDRWLQNGKKLLWLLPMWVLATGNLWGGVGVRYAGLGTLYAALSMALVGFVEEMIFRGFLFNGMRKTGKLTPAIIVSAATFGMGHIVNLISGQATLETLIQIVFAISWGFLFTYGYYKGGTLLPCILIHSLVDVGSVFARENVVAGNVFVACTVLTAVVYCLYLSKQPTPKQAE